MAMTSFDFDKKLTETIDKLKKDMGATSRSEVLRRAIALLQVANTATRDGSELVIKKKGQTEKHIILG